jgi:hypothetical protein
MSTTIKTYYSEVRQTVFYAGHNDMEMLEKTPTESLQVEWEFASILPEGQILDEALSNVTVLDEDDINVTSSIVGSSFVVNNSRLRTILNNGTNAKDGIVKFQGVTDPDGLKYEGFLLLQIRDKKGF